MKLKEEISLENGGTASEGCLGAIAEVFKDGDVYMVELFGQRVTVASDGDFAKSTPDVVDSFMETIGVETFLPHHLRSVAYAKETVGVRAQLLDFIDKLPTTALKEVKNLTEFLK